MMTAAETKAADAALDYLEISRAAGLVVATSLVVFPEALVVWVSSNGVNIPVDQLDGTSEVFPPGVVLGSGAAEVFLVFLGILLGFGSLLFQINAPSFTLICVGLTLILGWYVFVVNTIAHPVFNFENDGHPPVPPADGWATDFRKEVTFYMGYMVSSMALCAIAIGFQFFAVLYLYKVQTGVDEKQNVFKHRCRLGYYSFLITTLGAGMLTVACWVRVQEGASKLPSPVVYPPNIIIYPDVQVMGGVWTVVYGLLGFATVANPSLVPAMKIYAIALWCWYIGFHVMTQVSLAGPGFAGPACQLGMLFTAAAVAPAFFAHELETAVKTQEDGKNKSAMAMKKV